MKEGRQMNRTIFALAAVIASGAVHAQSSVTLYGVVDVNLEASFEFQVGGIVAGFR